MTSGALSPKQDQAVLALLTCPTLTDAARQVGIGDKTLHRWLKEPAFQAAYQACRHAVVRQAVAQLQQAMTRAVQTLIGILDNANVHASTQVSAARVILEMGLRATELEELDTRVRALETLLQEGGR